MCYYLNVQFQCQRVKLRGIYWLANNVLASRKGFWSIDFSCSTLLTKWTESSNILSFYHLRLFTQNDIVYKQMASSFTKLRVFLPVFSRWSFKQTRHSQWWHFLVLCLFYGCCLMCWSVVLKVNHSNEDVLLGSVSFTLSAAFVSLFC